MIQQIRILLILAKKNLVFNKLLLKSSSWKNLKYEVKLVRITSLASSP